MAKPRPLPPPEASLSRLDRALLYVAPKWALRRIQARQAAISMARHFDAADPGGRRAHGWNRSPTDANAAQAPALLLLREYARELKRNNGWARRGIKIIANNTVGGGIRPRALASSPRIEKLANDLWRDWALRTTCDYDGRLPFYGLQRLAMEAVVESGDCLIRRFRDDNAGSKVQLRIKVLESDYLDVHRDGLWGQENGPIIQGVEFNAAGQRVAYWLYDQHPGSYRLWRHTYVSKRVPAEDVIHVYDVDRPGAVRGVSWLAAAIAKLHDFDDYEDATLMAKKVAACFAAFVTDIDGSMSPIGRQDPDKPLLETLEPGLIQYLPPGKSITFAAPPQDAVGQSFSQGALRRIAATLGVTYEELTQDYSGFNFSSSRLNRLTHWANVSGWQKHMLIPQLCDGVWGWVMETAELQELLPEDEIPGARWLAPTAPMIEPDREGLAYSRLVRNGVMTLQEMIHEQGNDPDTHLAEIAAANAELDKLGIVLDCDPRKTNGSGAQIPQSDAEPEGKKEQANG